MNGKRLELSDCAQLEKNEFNKPWSPPSKLPFCTANCVSLSNVSKFGRNTYTPLLKQSGHPTSGAADNSSRSNNSSQFCNTYEFNRMNFNNKSNESFSHFPKKKKRMGKLICEKNVYLPMCRHPRIHTSRIVSIASSVIW